MGYTWTNPRVRPLIFGKGNIYIYYILLLTYLAFKVFKTPCTELSIVTAKQQGH